MMKLLERDVLLGELDAALREAVAGQGHIVLVSGEAGIGKTSLIEDFANTNKGDVRVLWGMCDALFTPRPLGPLHDIAIQLEGELLELLIAGVGGQSVFSACLHELQKSPTLAVFEDIHWADDATLDLLKYLGRRIHRTTSLMILTYRDDEIGLDHPLRSLLGDLASSQSLHRIAVSPLSENAVRMLAKDKHMDPIELYRLTNGNPFFVTEVLAGDGGIPATVRDAVLARAARLPDSARRVLEAAAVIGSKIEPWLLSQVNVSDASSIDECVSMGMLQSHDGYYSFRHELARQTILESISAQRKIDLHRIALDTLKGSPETRNDFARLVDYAEGMNDVQAVLEYAPAAGRQASALGAHRQATAHYRTALQYANLLPPEERAELLDRYADECEATVQMTDAEHAQQEALHLWQELGQGEKEGRALRRLSEIVMRQNQDSNKMKHYASEAVAVLEKLPPSKELAIAYSHRSRMHMIVYEVEETYYWGNRAMDLAEQLGDIETLSHSLTNIGIVEMWHDQPNEGQKKLERSLQLSRKHGYHNHAARAFNNLVDGLIVAHDYATCLTYANEGLQYCNKHDLENGYIELLSYRIRANFDQGRWVEAEKDIHVTQEFAATLENRSYVDLFQLKLKVRRGGPLASNDFDKLRTYAHEAIFHAVTYPIAELLAESAWLRGDLIQCRAEVESFFQGACQLNIPSFIGRLGYWMWRAGAITEPPSNAAEPYASQISGNWRAAASMWETYGCPYEQGMALMDGDEAAQLKALEIFERLGAQPILKILKRKMRAQGIRIPRGPRPTTRQNRYGLTVREMEVLDCLVDGSNNREIAKILTIAPRTVEHHIASILRKMGVQSRFEAVAQILKDKQTHSK